MKPRTSIRPTGMDAIVTAEEMAESSVPELKKLGEAILAVGHRNEHDYTGLDDPEVPTIEPVTPPETAVEAAALRAARIAAGEPVRDFAIRRS